MIAAGVKVTRRDAGLAELQRLIRAMDGAAVLVGVQGQDAARRYAKSNGSPGATVAEVATYQEFGTATIPTRSFLRRTAFERRGDLKASIVRNLSRLFRNPTTGRRTRALARIGSDAAIMVRGTLGTAPVWAKPLAPSTVAKKGHDRPLFETGILFDSISYSITDATGREVDRGR